MYFQHYKIREVAHEKKPPLHAETKASGRGSLAPSVTGEDPNARSLTRKGAYHAETGSAPAPGGLVGYLYPHLDKAEKEKLENLTVQPGEGAFGRTLKQAALHDINKKDQKFEETLRRYQEGEEEKEDAMRTRSQEHLADLEARKRNF